MTPAARKVPLPVEADYTGCVLEARRKDGVVAYRWEPLRPGVWRLDRVRGTGAFWQFEEVLAHCYYHDYSRDLFALPAGEVDGG